MFTINETQKIIMDRTEMAKALNFGKYKVLKYNFDEDKGSVANIEYQSGRYGIMKKSTTLYCGKITADDGIFYLLNSGTMISAHVGVYDWLKCADNANAPVIYEGDEVAILVYSEKFNVAYVRLVRALKPTPEYSTALAFEDL